MPTEPSEKADRGLSEEEIAQRVLRVAARLKDKQRELEVLLEMVLAQGGLEALRSCPPDGRTGDLLLHMVIALQDSIVNVEDAVARLCGELSKRSLAKAGTTGEIPGYRMLLVRAAILGGRGISGAGEGAR